MRKKQLLGLVFLSMGALFVSCDNDDDPAPQIPGESKTTGVYILNEGLYGENNSTLDYYDSETQKLTSKVFSTVNGRKLGDTANDIIIYGSKMYIAVNHSATIEVTDLNGESLHTISPKDDAGIPEEPRMLEAYAGKVYVTLFNGYLACIDTTSMKITKKLKVGAGPEGVCESNGLLYVANSGGWNAVKDSTLSVIDPKTFTETKKIKVELNPCYIRKNSEGNLYVISMGNYSTDPATLIPNTLQRIDVKTGEVEFVTKATAISINGNTLYAFYNQYSPSNPTAQYFSYDTKTDKILLENFISDGTNISSPCSISVDPISGNVYIGSSDYTNTGDVYIFSPEGKLVHSFGTSGITPKGAFFITNK